MQCRPYKKIRQRFLVLYCNYNGEMGQQRELFITFDWGGLLTQGQCVQTTFCKFLQGSKRFCKMQISNNDQKKDTPVKSYDQISFLDDLQCKTNSFSRDLFVGLWILKMWWQDCAALVQKKITKFQKMFFCYRIICSILRMPKLHVLEGRGGDVQIPRDQVFEWLRRAAGLHGRLVSTGEKNRRVGKKWCQVFWEMKCLTP